MAAWLSIFFGLVRDGSKNSSRSKKLGINPPRVFMLPKKPEERGTIFTTFSVRFKVRITRDKGQLARVKVRVTVN